MTTTARAGESGCHDRTNRLPPDPWIRSSFIGYSFGLRMRRRAGTHIPTSGGPSLPPSGNAPRRPRCTVPEVRAVECRRLLALLLFACAPAALALSPDRAIAQFHHTAW